MPFDTRTTGMRTALEIINRLPTGAKWSFTITDEDVPTNPGVFNIFVEDDIERQRIIRRLHRIFAERRNALELEEESEDYTLFRAQRALEVSVTSYEPFKVPAQPWRIDDRREYEVPDHIVKTPLAPTDNDDTDEEIT